MLFNLLNKSSKELDKLSTGKLEPNITRLGPNWLITVLAIGFADDSVQSCSNIPSPDNLQLTFFKFDKCLRPSAQAAIPFVDLLYGEPAWHSITFKSGNCENTAAHCSDNSGIICKSKERPLSDID